MIPYLVTFLATAFSMNQLQKSSFKTHKWGVAFWGTVSVLLPSILGGMRSVYLGTDNTRYAPEFYAIGKLDFPLEAIEYSNHEPSYNLLCYFVSRFTNDYHVLCFITELITMTFIVMGIYYYKNEISMALGILVYLFTQYCNCINLVRQGIALAIVFFAMRYAHEKKIIPFVALILLAVTFHTTAMIGLLIYIVYWIYDQKNSLYYAGGLCIIIFIAVNSSYYIARIMVTMHLLDSRYLNYLTPGLHFSFKHSVFCIPVLIVTTILYKYLSKKFEDYKCLYLLLWCEIITVQLADVFDPTYRISLYFNYANIIILPMIPHAFNKKFQPTAIIIVLLYLIAYWVFFVVFNRYGFGYPVYPYITDLF